MQQMFGGYRTDIGRQLRTAERNDLVRMHLGPHSQPLRRRQQLAGLIYRKDALFAKNIAKLRQLALCHDRQHLVQQVFDKFIGPAFVLRRGGMRSHEGRYYFDHMGTVQFGHSLQLLDFCRRVQPITAFAFHRRHTEGQHGTQTLPTDFRQFFLRGFPRGPDAIHNAAAPFHDLHIGIPAQPPGKFLCPVPGKQEVRMRVDESGQNAASGGVEHFSFRRINA